MKTLFDKISLGRGVTLKNRLCRSATVEGLCRNGDISPDTVDIYRALGAGGVGLIISGMTEVSPSGRYIDSVSVAWKDDYARRLAPVCDAAKAEGGVFLVQLAHSGIKSRALDNPLLAPSDITLPGAGVTARGITKDEIKKITEDFVSAAVKAKSAGADGIQIHNTHGYLLSEFFSPYTNRRRDKYGGDLENRSRFVTEIYDAIRQSTGEDFIIGIKTSCSDLISPSVTCDECVWLLQKLGKRGLDFAEISAGLIPGSDPPEKFIPSPQKPYEPIFYQATKYIAERVDVPVWSVCGWRDPTVMEGCINDSRIAGISMCTPFIREPSLVNRWLSGDRSPARCTSCMACEIPTRFAARCLPKPDNLKPITQFGCPAEKAICN